MLNYLFLTCSGCSNLKSLLFNPSLRCQDDVTRVEVIFRGLLDLSKVTRNLTEFGWWFGQDLDGDKTWPELLPIVLGYEFSNRLKSLRIGSTRIERCSDVLFLLLDLNSAHLQSLVFTGDVQSCKAAAAKKNKRMEKVKEKGRSRRGSSASSIWSYDEPDYLKRAYTGSYVSKMSPEQKTKAKKM